MASSSPDPGLVIAIYNPSQSFHTKQLQRSAARAHAARVSHRRRRNAQSSQSPTGSADSPLSVKRESHSAEVEWQTDHRYPKEIRQGVSDPFDCMAVRITPEVSMLLGLWKAHNTSTAVSAISWIGETTMRLDLVMDSELRIKSLLFLCSALLSSSVSPDRRDIQLRRLEHKHNCLQQFTLFIKSQGKDNKLQFFQALCRVFVATVLSNEPVEAKVHASQLYAALTAVVEDDLLSEDEQVILLNRCYYYDQRCALIHMRPPVLDPQVGIGLWETHLTPIRNWSKHQNLGPGAVRSPAFSKTLEELFRRLQEYINIQCFGLPKLSRGLARYASTCPVIFESKLTSLLFNHLEFTEDRILDEADTDSDKRSKWHNEGILTLAALAFLACAVSACSLNRGVKAMQMLRVLLESAPNPTSKVMYLRTYQNSQLWALYVGASWEWDSGSYESGRNWFTEQLKERVHELAIISWVEFKEIINGFLLVPAQEQGSSFTWFLGMDCVRVDPKLGIKRQSSSEFLNELLFCN